MKPDRELIITRPLPHLPRRRADAGHALIPHTLAPYDIWMIGKGAFGVIGSRKGAGRSKKPLIPEELWGQVNRQRWYEEWRLRSIRSIQGASVRWSDAATWARDYGTGSRSGEEVNGSDFMSYQRETYRDERTVSRILRRRLNSENERLTVLPESDSVA